MWPKKSRVYSCAKTKPKKKKKETDDMGITCRNGDRRIRQTVRITSEPPTRIKKGSQCIQFRWTFSKVIPVEKT